MIYLNSEKVKVGHFPDGTQMLLDLKIAPRLPEHFIEERVTEYVIDWHYKNDEECMTLWFLVGHIRDVAGKNAPITLRMKYLPNARMDRVKKDEEVFTLKHFAAFINSLNFNKVILYDPHSDVSPAIFNNAKINVSIELLIKQSVRNAMNADGDDDRELVIYFPDAGAQKRYADFFNDPWYKEYCDLSIMHGAKLRDWNTGKIQGITICNRDGIAVGPDFSFNGRKVLMIDDIISYGGTLAYSADKLKELCAGDIYAYATHTENSVLDEEKGTLLKRLKSGVVKKIYTTNSIFRGDGKNEIVKRYFDVMPI